MKKLLGILVLGLLWCNVGVAEVLSWNCDGGKHVKSIRWMLDLEKNFLNSEGTYNDGGTWKDYETGKIISKRNNYVVVETDDIGIWEFHYTNDEVYAILKGDKINYGTCYNTSVKVEKPEQSPDDNKIVAASMGSGFFVTSAGHLVTNYHVIEGCNAVKTNITGKEIRTDIIAVDKTNDLAIIKAEMNPSKVFPVSNEDVSLMQDVIVAGFPLGKKVSSAIKIHKGSVTALAGFGDNYSNFQTDATINQGNSGGPIMNQKGNVVGVAVQLIAAEHAQNVFFGVKSSTLRTFANANNIKFISPNYREKSNEDLGKLITEATVYLECWMTVAKIKQMISQAENTKAFYSKYK